MNRPTVVFDFDGTLTANLPEFIFHVYTRYFEEVHGTKLKFQNSGEIIKKGVSSTKKLTDIMEMHGVPAEKFPEFLEFYTSLYHGYVKTWSWMPGVFQQLRRIRVRTAICTNNTFKNVGQMLGDHLPLVDHVHCMQDLQHLPRKPLPESYQAMSELWAFGLATSLYVTDEFDDANGAKGAGFANVVMVPWGASTPEELLEARDRGIHVVDSFREMLVSINTHVEFKQE